MRFLLLGVWLAAGFTPQAPAAGSEVAGVVRFTGEYKPRKLNAQVDRMKHGAPARGDKDVFDETVVLGSKGELANVLVRFVGLKGEEIAPKDPVDLDAAGYLFSPRVVAVRTGGTVRLKNSALENCNFHVEPKINREVNVGVPRDGRRDVRFSEPEVGIRVMHDCCPWMIAWIHVLDHPYFAVTGADGAFRIRGLPAGTYELEAWHEKFGVRRARVTVGAAEAKVQDLVFEGK